MIRVLLFGACGRMGRMVLEQLAGNSELETVAGVERDGHPDLGKRIGGVKIIADDGKYPAAEVWVDFSLPASATAHCRSASTVDMPVVLAATGFAGAQMAKIRRAAQHSAILLTPNLSTGMGVMERLAAEAGNLLQNDFDPVIVELHHSAKKDAPSGTALRLGERMAETGPKPLITALRAGGAIGEHSVRFVGADEELIITHRAWSRRAFARGVPRAVKFIIGKPAGLYSLRDLYGK